MYPTNLPRPRLVVTLLIIGLALGMTQGQAAPGSAPLGAAIEERRFVVTAKRFVFSAKREVRVELRPSGTVGFDVTVELDKPVPVVPGLNRLRVPARLLDSDGVEIAWLRIGLERGSRRTRFSLELPGRGRYRLVLREDDIDVGRGRVTIRPGGEVVIPLVALD